MTSFWGGSWGSSWGDSWGELAPPASGSQIKVWNGTAWVLKPLMVRVGSDWVPAVLKYWNGSAWVTV